MALGGITAQVMHSRSTSRAYIIAAIFNVVFVTIMPAAILLINVVVAIQVRRAAIRAAANLGVQPHHQSTSAVPTIMLITTSLIYVLFQAMRGIFYMLSLSTSRDDDVSYYFVHDCYFASEATWKLIFAYNFYVYLITGKQFRSDVHKLFCRCVSSSSSSSASALTPANAHARAHAPAPVVIAARRVRADTAVTAV